MWIYSRILLSWIAISSLNVEFCLGGTEEESAIITYLYNKCNVEQADKVKIAVDEFTANMDLKFSYITQNPEHFCHKETVILKNGVTHVMDEFSHCLAPDETFLKKFAVDSFNGFLEFICYRETENINMFFSKDGQECLTALKSNETNPAVEKCFSKILGPSQNHVKKEELCRDLKLAETCFADIISQKCRSTNTFFILVKRLFFALEKPCLPENGSSAATLLNGTLMMGLLAIAVLVKKSILGI